MHSDRLADVCRMVLCIQPYAFSLLPLKGLLGVLLLISLPHTLIGNLGEDVGLYIKGILSSKALKPLIFWKSDILHFFTFP